MNKGLEALKDFYIFFNQCEIENKYDKQLTNHFLSLHDIIEKELKALNIFINKKVIWWLVEHYQYQSAEDYNKSVPNPQCYLTEEEFELIKEIYKEVLSNE